MQILLKFLRNNSITNHLNAIMKKILPFFSHNKVLLCESCPNLHTLIIRELISTATLLIIITTAQCLTRFLVRRNAIIKKFDWKKQTEWSDEFYNWLKNKSRSYEDTFEEVSKILGKKWYPLTDEEFKRITPDITF
jgi:F-box protein 39